LERLKREASKKELKPVVYKPADLEKFRKNFYIESKEITTMTDVEIKTVLENLGDIQVKGLNVPRPIKSWY
jgi:ATP-dependent RNA helicase DDX46/PRP5